MTTTVETVEELFGDITVRWYQIAARNQTAQFLAQGIKRILIKQPTGAGKTLTIACSLSHFSIREALNVKPDAKLRVLFVSHKHRLLTQAKKTFEDIDNVELILQSMFSQIPTDVVKAGWDVCVFDECHHEAANSFQYHLDKLGDRPIIGLTATDMRPDGCILKFQRVVNPISREQAVAEGWLAETSIYSIVDTASTDKTNIIKQVFNQFSTEFGQMMVFVRTKKEVQSIADHLISLGYKAVALLNQTDKQINQILDDFSDKKIQFIVNCNKINEGVDVKGCTDVFLGRQFGSYTQLNQVIGRAARPDSPCNVWELINPLSGSNLDTTVIVGTPVYHRLSFVRNSVWHSDEFDYTTTTKLSM